MAQGNPPPVVQHIRTNAGGAGQKSATFSSWLCFLCVCPAPSSAGDNLCLWAGASLSSAPYPGETAFPVGLLPISCRPPQ